MQNAEQKTALIAMSGGVDSSIAAYLMRQADFRCMGTTMRLYRNEDLGACNFRNLLFGKGYRGRKVRSHFSWIFRMRYWILHWIFRRRSSASLSAPMRQAARPIPVLTATAL